MVLNQPPLIDPELLPWLFLAFLALVAFYRIRDFLNSPASKSDTTAERETCGPHELDAGSGHDDYIRERDAK